MTSSRSQFDTAVTGERTCVLVVDDDRSQRVLCAAHLRRDGYDVIEASNGVEALDIVAHRPPDIIVMDVHMPVMDGLACAEILKAKPTTSHIPIIMASASTGGDDIVAGLEAGADEYVAKPLDSKVFRLRVRSMVRLSKATRALRCSTDALGEQNRNLGIILDLSFDLNTADDGETIARRVVDAAADITGCRNITLMLPDDQRTTLRFALATSVPIDVDRPVLVPIGEGVSGRAFLAANPMMYNDPEQLHRDMHPNEAEFLDMLPLLAVPICTADQTLGVLNISDRVTRTPFTPKDFAYVDMLSNLAASSLHDLHARRARDDAHESIVVALAKLAEHRDDDTGKHLDRVTEFSITLATELRPRGKFSEIIDDAFIRDLRLAVPLHDIGKVAVPDKILLKPGRLDPAEIEIMRTHVRFGTETIRSVRERAPHSHFLQLAEEVCAAHHEWFNGEGYPNKIAGDAIPLSARIAAIADVYDALTSKRVYKPAMPHEKAFNIIVGASGTQFDPDVVQAFIDREDDFIHLAKELGDEAAGSEANGPLALTNSGPRDKT